MTLQQYRYIGDKKLLSSCKYLHNHVLQTNANKVCVDGSCEGYINGECPFYTDYEKWKDCVKEMYVKYFISCNDKEYEYY